jgi:sRNA-binding carbon storage regulator CsrA
MLVFNRKLNEIFQIGVPAGTVIQDHLTITAKILGVDDRTVKLGIDAPKCVAIARVPEVPLRSLDAPRPNEQELKTAWHALRRVPTFDNFEQFEALLRARSIPL